MIKNFERPILGHIAYSIVGCEGKFFEVSTINLPSRRIESYATEWRDDWWRPPYPNETMVWECKESGERLGGILHCQGYRKPEAAKQHHQRLCHKIEEEGNKALNGRHFQTAKREKDGKPVGLIEDLDRRLKGIMA